MNDLDELIEKALATVQGEALFSKTNLYHTVDMAVAKAEAIKVPVTICISDSAGEPRMVYRMPEAKLVSLRLAPKKANSALMMQAATKDLNRDTQPGGELYGMETMLEGELVTFAGGIPLTFKNRTIGAIGVSGGTVAEDHLICETAISTFLQG